MALKELKTNNDSSLEVVNKSMGLTKSRVLDLLGLLDLPEEIKEDIRQKKLTGDQSLELVRKIKGEPGFTIEEIFNSSKEANKKTSQAKSVIELIFE